MAHPFYTHTPGGGRRARARNLAPPHPTHPAPPGARRPFPVPGIPAHGPGIPTPGPVQILRGPSIRIGFRAVSRLRNPQNLGGGGGGPHGAPGFSRDLGIFTSRLDRAPERSGSVYARPQFPGILGGFRPPRPPGRFAAKVSRKSGGFRSRHGDPVFYLDICYFTAWSGRKMGLSARAYIFSLPPVISGDISGFKTESRLWTTENMDDPRIWPRCRLL